MTEDVIIRKIEEQDFSQIVALFREFAGFQNISERMVNSVERMMAEKDMVNGFVAETLDKQIIGYVTWFFCYYTFVGKSLYMDDLYVSPAYRASGIGTKLMNEVIKVAKGSGCHKLRWQVSNWNHPAVAFYQKLGAQIDDIERNCDLVFG